MFISVLLPDPDVPITATYSFRPTSRSTPSSARICSTPTRYSFVMSRSRMTAMDEVERRTGCLLLRRLRRRRLRRRALLRLVGHAPVVLDLLEHLVRTGDHGVALAQPRLDYRVRHVAGPHRHRRHHRPAVDEAVDH